MITPADAAARRTRGLQLARREGSGGEPELTVRVLGSFNLDLLPPYLVEALDRYEIRASVAVRPFMQTVQEVLDPGSELYADVVDVIVLVVSTEDADRSEDERLEEVSLLVNTLLERLPGATIVLVPMGASRLHAEHVLSPLAPERGRARADRFLAGAHALSAPRVLVADWEWRVRRVGAEALEDRRLWYLARMRLGPVGLAQLAEVVAETVAASRGGARKVCAVDLDGVLWGGTVGEVGLGGIELGEDGLGLAFQDLQRVLLTLQETGTVLAICSRNNPSDVDDVFERHPGMLLRREHFAAERINWEDKAANLRELAFALGLGLDSFVFLDDDPVQRAWMRAALPEVVAPELPSDPADRPDFLRRAPFFQRITLTTADLDRSQDYRRQRLRRDLQEGAPSLEEFIAQLEQHVLIELVHEGTFSRARQLVQRTNQFNLTARRYSAAELEALCTDASTEIYTLAVSDRFGESGITGLAILRLGDGEAEIDTLLLSCRVLGRRIEDVLLAFLAERARSQGARRLVGHFVPDGKNEPARSFYADRGFEGEGGGRFTFDLEAGEMAAPPGITVHVTAHA